MLTILSHTKRAINGKNEEKRGFYRNTVFSHFTQKLTRPVPAIQTGLTGWMFFAPRVAQAAHDRGRVSLTLISEKMKQGPVASQQPRLRRLNSGASLRCARRFV
jgi:hypothetical protein